MRVAVVSGGGVTSHAPSRALVRQLRAAGNRVEVREHVGVSRGPAAVGRRVRDLVGGPDLVVPANRGDVEVATGVARRAGGLLVAPPVWEVDPAVDAAWHAPDDPALSTAPAGPGLDHHLRPAAEAGVGDHPRPDRHAGRTLVVVARWTAATPARYLADAAERAGMQVRRTDRLDRGELGDVTGLVGVVVVESPLPALPVTGEALPDVPVLFWAHHGEHHTDTQLRLVRHYGADAVLLAHSWHLAHRFPRPVHRFPFGLPASLVGGGLPFDRRPLDAAFLGSGIDGGGAYARRGELLASLREHLGDDRVAFESGQPPERLAELYGSARLVPNDCGSRHRPITMRVFEAVGAGAVLLTDDAPGLDRLLDPAGHHVVIEDPVGVQAKALLAAEDLGARADAALTHARTHHTTDHRVDELLAVFAATDPQPPLPLPPEPADPLLRPVAEDLLLDDVLPLGVEDTAGVEEQLPDRVVWEVERLERLADRPLAHAVVVAAGWSGDAERAVRAARRLVVTARRDIADAALASAPAAVVRSERDGLVAIDLGTPGYRIGPATSQEAT